MIIILYLTQLYYQMGQQQNRSTKQTQMSVLNVEGDDIYQQFQENRFCCGIQYVKTIKKKLVWQNEFVKNCQAIKQQYRWASEMLQLIKIRKLARSKYIVEMNQIKKQTATLIIPQNQILLSPGQVQEFKSNLKKSVLLSFGHAKLQLNEPSKITTSINPTSMIERRSKIGKDRYGDHFRISIVKNQKSFSNKNIQGKSNLRKSIMSFVDDTISSVFGGQDKQISKQNAKAVQNFLKFSMILEKHFADNENMLCKIQKTFINYMKKIYSDPKIACRDIEGLTNNIKQFLILMRQTVYDYYNLLSFNDEDLHALITNQENILTVVTSILFKNTQFYQMIFNAIVDFNMQNDQTLNRILAKIQGSIPQFFQIKDQYCLNKNTIKKNIQKMSLQSTQNKIDNFDIQQLQKNSNTGNQVPYKSCMQALRELQRSKTPIGKMKIIMSCSEKITKSISQFYQNNGLKMEQWVLDADQILSIFCYILANAKIPHLHTHLFILQNFSTDHQLISVTGYYYSVLTCALQQVQTTYRNLIE